MNTATKTAPRQNRYAKKPYPIRYILTHTRAHMDEIVAYLLAYLYGTELFPGIRTATWVFTDAGSNTYRGMNGIQALERGYLPLGILAENPFNEHATSSGDRLEDEATATLMATWLGVDQLNPCWQKVLNKVKADDTEAEKSPIGMSHELAAEYAENPDKVNDLIRQFAARMMIFYRQQLKTKIDGDKARPHFRMISRQLPSGRRIRVLRVNSDSERMIGYITSYLPFRERPDLIVQRHSSGQHQVHTNYASNLCIDDVAAALRLAEAKERGLTLPNDPELLRSEGNLLGVAMWGYLMGKKKMKKLFNGGLTAPNAEPTKLPTEQIIDIIFANVKPEPPKDAAKAA